MRITVILLLLLLPLRLFAAVGDIVGVSIETNGWQALVYVAGLNTNGTYAFGLSANNTATGSEKFVLTLDSPGYDDTGTSGRYLRKIYGTFRVRKPTPNDGSADEVYSAGTNKIRISMSDYVYSGDSNLTATIASGLYTLTGTPNNSASGVTVTNNSAAAHQPVIAQWSWPNWQRITGSTFTLHAVAYHNSARDGRPVRAVRFIATDQSSHSTTTIVTRATSDSTIGDVYPVAEYIGTMDASTFTATNIVTCSMEAFPWIGDTNSVFYSSNITNADPTPYPRNQSYLMDASATYKATYAVVSTNGTDATGKAVTPTYWETNTSPPEFATIAGALTAIRATNNTLYTRSDPGAAQVYLRAGNHTWMGGSGAYGSPGSMRTWAVVENYPGTTRSNVVLSAYGSDKGMSAGKMCVRGVKITATNAGGVFSTDDAVWFDNCEFASSGDPVVYQEKLWYITRCLFTTLQQGVIPFSTVNCSIPLIRASQFTEMNSGINQAHVILGNYIANDNWQIQNWVSGTTAPIVTRLIVAHNWVKSAYTSGHALSFFAKDMPISTNIGAAIVQNVLENTTTNGQALLWVSADSTTNTPIDNVLIWNNTLVGQRLNYAYNDLGTNAALKRGWSLNGNFIDDINIKTDTFSTSSSNRLGNWSELWGAGFTGNFFPETYGIGASGFTNEFPGLGTFMVSSGTSTNTLPQFISRASANGLTNGFGDGNYRLNSTSPMFGTQSRAVMPFDMQGVYRGGLDPAGAYTSGNVRKGPLF